MQEEEEGGGGGSGGGGGGGVLPSVSEKACPRKSCGARLRHFKREGGTHDVMCDGCDATVCFLCLAVWSIASECGCENRCGGGCACAVCPACRGEARGTCGTCGAAA